MMQYALHSCGNNLRRAVQIRDLGPAPQPRILFYQRDGDPAPAELAGPAVDGDVPDETRVARLGVDLDDRGVGASRP